jgi:hypothetical protein
MLRADLLIEGFACVDDVLLARGYLSQCSATISLVERLSPY